MAAGYGGGYGEYALARAAVPGVGRVAAGYGGGYGKYGGGYGGYGAGYGGYGGALRRRRRGSDPGDDHSGYGGYGRRDRRSGYGNETVDAEETKLAQARRLTSTAPDYKLFRFIDYSVKKGRTYRYRVRLCLEDPNNPEDSRTRPFPDQLKGEVISRLIDIRERSGEGGRRTYWRYTDWSEPSAAIEIPRAAKDQSRRRGRRRNSPTGY